MTRPPTTPWVRLVRMERHKLITLRVSVVLAAAGLVASALIAAGYAWVVLQVGADLPVSAVEATTVTTTRTSVTTIVVGLLGVLCVSSDRRSGGLELAVVIEPDRSRVVLAKALVAAAAGASLGLTALAANTLVAVAVLGRSGLVADAWSWLGLGAGAVCVHAGWAVIGVAIGLLVRSTSAAVLTLVAGPWLLGRALAVLALTGASGGILERAASFNPFAAAARLQSPLTIPSPVIVADGSGGGVSAVAYAALSFAVLVVLALAWAGRSFTTADLQRE